MNLTGQISALVDSIVQQTIQKKVEQYKSLLTYELQMLNLQVAMMSKHHGYDYKTIPDTIINNIQVSTTSTGATISISSNLFEGLDQRVRDLVEFGLNNVFAKIDATQKNELPEERVAQ